MDWVGISDRVRLLVDMPEHQYGFVWSETIYTQGQRYVVYAGNNKTWPILIRPYDINHWYGIASDMPSIDAVASIIRHIQLPPSEAIEYVTPLEAFNIAEQGVAYAVAEKIRRVNARRYK